MSEQRPRYRMMTLAEIRARHQSSDPQPPRRLTGAELEDLRARLNRGEHPRGEAEHNARYELGIIRYVEAVDDLISRVHAQALDAAPDSTSRQYAAGILDAIAWARGELPTGPVTNRRPATALPGTQDLEGEAAAAARVLRGQERAARELSTSYVSGVEATLLWALCSAPDPWT
ncbi:hypothetical protein [Nocardiopsis deserti]|uniref:hypothetical protein n=1 Tax=Nocardiopsis deserti TaxID=2605988 RepID=UPI001239FD49|nr:hypothetical protein [Nocardiopsis deserti]